MRNVRLNKSTCSKCINEWVRINRSSKFDPWAKADERAWEHGYVNCPYKEGTQTIYMLADSTCVHKMEHAVYIAMGEQSA